MSADIIRFLFGNADAIRRVLGNRWSLPVAAILVLTAGIARRYDQELLLNHYRWLGLPFLVAGLSSFLIFCFVWSLAVCRLRRGADLGAELPGFWSHYFGFLGAFLMTAPLAWLYAIPVETLTGDRLRAARWNTALLAVVSAWRVALIVRVFQVRYGTPVFPTLVLILIPSSIEAFFGAFSQRLNVVGVMGGILLPPHSQFLADAAGVVANAAVPVFLVAVCLVVAFRFLPDVRLGFRPEAMNRAIGEWRRVVDAMKPPSFWRAILPATVFLAVWIAIAAGPQLQLDRFYRLDSLTTHSQFEAAMERHRKWERSDLPPDFVVARRGFLSREEILGLLGAVRSEDPPWIRKSILEFARWQIDAVFTSPYQDAETRVEFLRQLSMKEGGTEAIAAYLRSEPEIVARITEDAGFLRPDHAERKEAVLKFLETIGIRLPGPESEK